MGGEDCPAILISIDSHHLVCLIFRELERGLHVISIVGVHGRHGMVNHDDASKSKRDVVLR